MASFSDYLETKVLGHVFGGTAYTAPTKYLALFTTAPGEAGGGTEVSGNGYARPSATFAVVGNLASNNATIAWPTVLGAGWGTVSHVGVFDADTGGNLLASGALLFSRELLAGDVFRIPAGELKITLE